MAALRERLSESLEALRDVFRNPNLRRLELAWAGSITGQWAAGIALAVYAYDRGGATAVGLVGLLRMLPAAFAAPFAAVLGDRFRRETVMVVSDLVRALVLAAAAAAVLAQAPVWSVYAVATFVGLVSTAFHPAQAALIPSLARTPGELTAANVASSTIESVGIFAGPALAGLLLALSSTGVVLAVTAGTFAWSALLIARISAPESRAEPANAGTALMGEILAGFRAVVGESRVRLLVGLMGAQTLVCGVLNVLIVVMALELFRSGDSGVGYLNSVIGVGGLVGAVAAIGLVGRSRLAGDFGFGIVLWGAPLALIGIWPRETAALFLLVLVGFGNSLVDITGFTLLQRSVPDDVLARVFGVLESVILGTIALGAAIAPALIEGLGTRTALIATGLFLPLLALLTWRRLAAIDAAARVPERELEILRSLPIFRPLPVATLEQLARSLVSVHVTQGEHVCRQGDPGDRFYVVASGELDVSVDGEASRRLDSGDVFGEIALLRDVPRTATVTARADSELLALERDEFVAAITGHAESARVADAVVATRLRSLRPVVGSI
jgi:MFS family permease